MTNTDYTTWQAKLSEANDAIGSALTALRWAGTGPRSNETRRGIEKELDYWIAQRREAEALRDAR